MQKKLGVVADGFWGPKSIAACQAHLKAIIKDANYQWPKATQPALQAFYGSPGDESKLSDLNVTGLGMMYEQKPVHTIRCHTRVMGSLICILEELRACYPVLLTQFDGCFNDRPMRNGSLPSLHARGAAIDFNAAQNGNTTAWPVRAVMPLEVMEIFAKRGWKSAGAFWGRDAMHFEATAI